MGSEMCIRDSSQPDVGGLPPRRPTRRKAGFKLTATGPTCGRLNGSLRPNFALRWRRRAAQGSPARGRGAGTSFVEREKTRAQPISSMLSLSAQPASHVITRAEAHKQSFRPVVSWAAWLRALLNGGSSIATLLSQRRPLSLPQRALRSDSAPMAKKKKTASTTGGVLGALATTAFSDEGAAASSLFSASEASLPPAR